jgi:hypothetical protein
MKRTNKEMERLVLLGQAGWPEAAVNAHLKQICESEFFDDRDRPRELLKYLVNEAILGHLLYPENIARALGKPNFGKGDAFVRAAMNRLRNRMEEYYAALPKKGGLRLVVPHGTYLVLATRNDSPSLAGNIPAMASILEPAEREEVYSRVAVRGRIDSLDPDARPWLIVLASDGFFYPQCRVSRRSPSWEYEVRIGRMQWGETDGVEFGIVLAAAGVDGDFDIEAYMKRNGDGYGTRLPADTAVIIKRSVIRRDIRPGGPTTDRLPPQAAS